MTPAMPDLSGPSITDARFPPIHAALGEYFEIDVGATIGYWRSGNGPPLVLLHGLLATALHWTLVAPRLARDFTVYVPELPFGGHQIGTDPGVDVSVDGQAALVSALLDALDLSRVCVVGNDTGGAIAQVIAVDHPGRLGSVIISDGDAFDNLPPPVFRYLCWLAYAPPALSLLMRCMTIPSINRSPLAFGWLTNRGLPAPVLAHYRRVFSRTGATRRDLVRFLRGVDDASTLRASRRFGEITLPVMIAWSEVDRVFPLAHARRMNEMIHGSELVTCRISYAYLPWDQPEWFAGRIASFASGSHWTGGHGARLDA